MVSVKGHKRTTKKKVVPIYKQLEAIVKERQYRKIDGLLVDMQTANRILVLRGALKPKTKKKLDSMSIQKQALFAWKLV